MSRFLRLLAAALALGGGGALAQEPADLILHNGKVYTVEESRPLAQAVAVRGGRIVRVGTNGDVLALKGPSTRAVDVGGRLVLPGFNDAHTHFENAVEWFFQVRLIDVNSQDELVKRVAEAAKRVPKGIWITGGDWGAFEAWRADRSAQGLFKTFTPNLAAIDAVSPDHPILLRSYDRRWFANSKMLAIARVTKKSNNPRGGEYEKDPVTGELTGMLLGTAGEIMQALMPPVTQAQKLIGARGIQKELNRVGITSIADIARIDDISQSNIVAIHVERSYSDMRIFEDLKARNELTVRVLAMLPLAPLAQTMRHGVRMGGGDDWIRYGALKAFGDSGVMFQPFAAEGLPNDWSFRFVGEEAMAKQILEADKAGFDVGVHIIGDKASHLLIDWYEAATRANPPRERRHRLIHYWHTTPEDIDRAARLGLVVDVTPAHLLRSLGAMERGLDSERARYAFAFRSMMDKGVIVNIVSDLPGSFNKASLSPYNPLENIYYVITRQGLDGRPPGGWHPEQALTIEQAIRAYTLNPARAAHEEKVKGSIAEGKLADLVVLSRDILVAKPQELLTTEVVYTILGGRIVHSMD